MNKEIIVLEEPKIPMKWNYDQSVKKIKVLVYKWKNLTAEVVNELFIAREILSSQGARTDLKEEKTWEDYCEEIGVERRTANRWLNRYLGTNDPKLELETPELPEGKYQVIYADPPWQYAQEQHSKEKQDTILETHYPTMPTEDICRIPVQELTGDNAVLFIWTTSPKLFEVKQVIDAWGFEYKASMIWDKVKHNVGYYVSVRHEFLLICTKGSCLPDIPKLHDSVVTEERTEHSKKPDIFYEIIEGMYKGKKIELFARKPHKNWDCWGNQL
jgi:N6-adenosine-specific RNA methylase IME4